MFSKRILVVAACAAISFAGLVGCSTVAPIISAAQPFIQTAVKDGFTFAFDKLTHSQDTRVRDANYLADFATALDSIDTGDAPDPASLQKLLELRVKPADLPAVEPIIDTVVSLYDSLLYPRLKARLGSGYVYLQDLQDFTAGCRAASVQILNDASH